MKPDARIHETVDQALKRLGTPPRVKLDAARERIREKVRSTNPVDMTSLPLLDMRPVSLWGLRQPFLIAGGVVIAFAALTATLWILSERNPVTNISKVAIEPARSALEPTINQAYSGATIRSQFKETPGAVTPEVLDPKSRAKAIKEPEPKRLVEKAELPEKTVTGLRPTTFPAIPLPEPIQVESEGDYRAVVDRVCTACHGLRAMEKYSYSSPDAYRDLVSDMISRGAVISDEEMPTILEYLYKTYGQK